MPSARSTSDPESGAVVTSRVVRPSASILTRRLLLVAEEGVVENLLPVASEWHEHEEEAHHRHGDDRPAGGEGRPILQPCPPTLALTGR